MAEWLDPEHIEDPENTTQDLLNELAHESDEIAGQVEFSHVSTDGGNVRNKSHKLLEKEELTTSLDVLGS